MQALEGVWPFVAGTMAQHAPVLMVTASGRQAEDVAAVLKHMLGDVVEVFPAWETLPHLSLIHI